MSSRLSQDIETLKVKLFEAEQALDTDSNLADSLSTAKNVVLAMPLIPGTPHGKPGRELPDYVLRNSVNQVRDRVSAQDRGLFPVATVRAISPIPEVGPFASAIGHLNTIPDLDGGIRSEALVLQYNDRIYPSMSLQIAAKSLNLDNNDMRINLAKSIELGSLEIKTDSQLMMNTFFYSDTGGIPAFQVDSFYDVVSGKIPLDKYKDKIVLIGTTATGVANLQVTPINPDMAPVVMLAHSVSSILNEEFFIEPEWNKWVRTAIFLGIGLYLMLAMPRLKAGIAAVVTLVLLLAIVVSHYLLMTSNTIWIPLVGPAVLLVLGHLLITTRRFLVDQRGKVKSDQGSSETNRMLGIANQGQLNTALWMKR
jgi:serine/threonine-protein kinase